MLHLLMDTSAVATIWFPPISTLTGKDLLSSVTASLTSLLSRLMEELFGPAVNAAMLGPITWADLGVCLCFLLLVLLLNAVVAFYLRHKRRQTIAVFHPKNWRTQLFKAAGMPLYVLIWIYGVYLAVTPLLWRLASGAAATHPLRQLFDKIFGLEGFAVIFWLCFRLTRVVEARVAEWGSKTESKLGILIVPLMGRSLRVIVLVVGIVLVLPLIGLSPEYAGFIGKTSSLLLIGAMAWFFFEAVHFWELVVLAKYDISVSDNLKARKVYTQVHVLSKTLYFIITIFTAASILMLFDEVRRFGTSLLASAGVIGIIVGFASQHTIANLVAGFQLALTQPIRLDDVIVFEGEWGRVEEINLTYVVINLWDERHLIVPLRHFIEKPFQNWTRFSAKLLGSILIWVDYSLPLDQVRQAAQQIVETSAFWDKRFWNMQVTEATDRAMQIRVLATAADSGKAWELRCDIREKLIHYIQKNFPQHLPHWRTDLDRGSSGTGKPPVAG